jgi:hypothetical protein
MAECKISASYIYKSVTVSAYTDHAAISHRHRSLFWHADAEFFDKELPSHLRNSTSSIERAMERGRITSEDMQLLKRANSIQFVYDLILHRWLISLSLDARQQMIPRGERRCEEKMFPT